MVNIDSLKSTHYTETIFKKIEKRKEEQYAKQHYNRRRKPFDRRRV